MYKIHGLVAINWDHYGNFTLVHTKMDLYIYVHMFVFVYGSNMHINGVNLFTLVSTDPKR